MSTAQLAEPTWISAAKTGRSLTETITLPERFDAFTPLELSSRDLANNASVVIEGYAVRFADRHALQALVDARIRALDFGGDLIIRNPSLELRVILELTGFDALLTVVIGVEQ